MKHSFLFNLTVAATLTAAVVLTHSIFMLSNFDQTQTQQAAGYIASEKGKAAFRYHGIGFAESDADNTLWFRRDGHKCRLYTQAFMDATYGKDYI